MKDQLVKFWKDEEGATAIEYALIAGLIAVVIIVALGALGDSISEMFNTIAEKVDEAKDGMGAGAGAGAGGGGGGEG